MVNNRCLATRRNGTSITETIVATFLLTTAAIGMSQMFGHARSSLRGMELSHWCSWEVDSAQAIIRSWPVEQVTAENIQQLPIADQIRQNVNDARWRAEVSKIEQPIIAMQVTLKLETSQYDQGFTVRKKLTFWLPVENRTADRTAAGDEGE